MKKLISYFMVGVMTFCCCSSAFAADRVSDSMFFKADSEKVIELSEADALEYDIYNINTLSDAAAISTSTITMEDIIDLCVEEGTENISGYSITFYTSDVLKNYLYNCDYIIEISKINNYIYISYMSNNNKTIVLSYDETGLYDKCIYNNDTGESVYLSEDIAYIDYAVSYEMSEELQEFIDEQIEMNGIESLYDIEQLNIIEVDGNYVIEERVASDEMNASIGISPMSSTAPTSDSELLSSLKKDFPMYTGKVMSSVQKKCAYLNKNVKVTIKDDRNSYAKSKADWKTFVLGTAVSAVATYLGGPASIAVKILTAAGIGISAANTIVTAVKLSKSAEYTYKANRYGYAYDTTKWNKDVLVQVAKSTGKFTGVYDKNGDFVWGHNAPSAHHDKSVSTWADNVIKYYNSDLVYTKGTTTFTP